MLLVWILHSCLTPSAAWGWEIALIDWLKPAAILTTISYFDRSNLSSNRAATAAVIIICPHIHVFLLTDWIYFIISFHRPAWTFAFITLAITPSASGIPGFSRHGSTYEKHAYSVRSHMIFSTQIFSCTVLSVSSLFVSVVCAFSLCSKAWSIFQENVIPVPGLFTRSRLHQRSETSSPRCCRYKSACVHARQRRHEYSDDICSSANTVGSTNCSVQTLQITHLPSVAAPPAHVHKFHPSICAFVLLVTSQQRSCLSDGLVLLESMPPAALTRLSAACRHSCSALSFTSHEVSVEICLWKSTCWVPPCWEPSHFA